MNPIIPDSQPAPSRGSFAIAAGILAAGCGPEEIPYLVAGFRHAAELEREITTAMTALHAAPAHVPFPQMNPSELAGFWEAVALLRAECDNAGDEPDSGEGAAVHGLSCACPECDNDEDAPYCATCGADVGIFIGHGEAWLHYTGQGIAADPVELYDAGHAPEVAWRPAGAR